MKHMEKLGFTELVSELQELVHEVTSLAQNSETQREVLNEVEVLVGKFDPILGDLRDNTKFKDHPPLKKAVESLGLELKRAKALVKSPETKSFPKQIEEVVHDLGRSLGLVLLASLEVSTDLKDKIGAFHKDLISTRFDMSSFPSTSYDSGVVSELEIEEEIQEEKRVCFGVDDVALQLKYGDDEQLRYAILELNELLGDERVSSEWINDEGIIPILFNRLSTSNSDNRLRIVQLLRTIASDNADNKEKMADVGFLSVLVKALVRDEEERKEAVGLLLDLSSLQSVRRRLGRIQGCIVMLVALLNGDDAVASHHAGKLLKALSSNTQNALHMAEAGYFKPLVQYLEEGSDMSKILMATALSRMELTDQSRASLGEGGAIEPLVSMFSTGKLEAKLSALSALQNLSNLTENIQRLISSGIVASLLQLLFSVTSVLMTLREPASAILARIAQSESILVNQDVAQQMLSLLNLSSPVIQNNLLQALNSIASHSRASKVRRKMKENGAFQLLLPFLKETNSKIRSSALNLLYTLSKDLPEELADQLGETYIKILINTILSSTLDSEKAAAVGILGHLPISDKKVTDMLKRANSLPILVSIMTSRSEISAGPTCWLVENITGVLIRFTNPSDKKLQLYSAEQGVIPLLVKSLSIGSPVAKSRAATSLAQLSQNSSSLKKSRALRWSCVPPSANAFCEVHGGHCLVKSTFCLVKAGAIPPMIQILEGKEREADEAVLGALATLLHDEIWENGSNYIAKMSGVPAIIKVLESGSIKAQEKALWILEKIFGVDEHRDKYGESAQVVLIDLAQQGDSRLKSATAKLLAQLELLQGGPTRSLSICHQELKPQSSIVLILRTQYEKKRKIREAIQEGKPIPTELRNEEAKLRQEIDLEDENTAVPRSHIDDEYAKASERDPKILLTTSRDPSAPLIQFTKELKLVFPNAQVVNRGGQVISEIVESCRAHDYSDLVLVHEHRGKPDGLIVCHLPYGPTAYFQLCNVVSRHDIKDKKAMGTVPQAYPHLIINNFTTKLGERTANILKHLFPVPKPDTKRIITFTNDQDYISFRHHIYDKPGGPKSIELKEIGPRFELKLFKIKLGTVDQNEAQNEWVLKPYMNTAKKQKFLGN